MIQDDPLNPISPGYLQREGSITGFNQVIDDTLTSMLTRGWSKEQLHQAILNFRETYGTQGVQQLLLLLLNHIRDHNNPHHVTIQQVADDVIGELVNPILPGTPPSTPPILGISPEFAVPMAFLPFTYTGASGDGSSMGIQVPDQIGRYDGYPGNLPPTSFRNSRRVIPMVADLPTTTIPVAITPLDGTQVGSFTGSDYVIMAPSGDQLETSFTGYLSTGTLTSPPGVTVTIPNPTNAVGSISYFLYASPTTTSVLATHAGNTLLFDLTALTVTASNPQIEIGDIQRLPNGIYRITHVLFLTSDPLTLTGSNATSLDGQNTLGSQIAPVFALSNVQVTPDVVSLDPLVAGVTSLSQSVLTARVPSTLDGQCMLALTLTSLPHPNKVERDIMTFGGVTLSATAMGYKFRTTSGTEYSWQTSQNAQFVKMAISLDNLAFKVKFQNEDKKSFAGDFTGLIPNALTFSIQNFNGDIRDLVLYSESDRDQMLEFLTDG